MMTADAAMTPETGIMAAAGMILVTGNVVATILAIVGTIDAEMIRVTGNETAVAVR
jgi:hypothetical protein